MDTDPYVKKKTLLKVTMIINCLAADNAYCRDESENPPGGVSGHHRISGL